mmetsp:Transcript_16149/g.38633  ORF Transcript_16149/g.38633 Transcript_16149/m.38633 type:complete len:93 (+) Transcript_16149:757-1035(+)
MKEAHSTHAMHGREHTSIHPSINTLGHTLKHSHGRPFHHTHATHTHTHTHSNPPTHHSIAYPRHTTHTTHERDTKLAHTPRGPIHPSIHLDK